MNHADRPDAPRAALLEPVDAPAGDELTMPGSVTEMARLMHELQVHRVELEMQHEEALQLRQELSAALDRYAELYESAPVGYFTLSREGVITTANLAGARLLGQLPEGLAGQQFAFHVAELDRIVFLDTLARAFATWQLQSCEIAVAGEQVMLPILQIEAMVDASGRECRAVALDISARKQSELDLRQARDALRKLSLRHEDRLNDERRRLSLEVHDHLGQMLTALKLQLDIMDPHLGDDPVVRAAAGRMRSLTEEVVEVVRNVALNLRPPALDLGLAPALEWLVEDFGLRWEIDVAVRCLLEDLQLNDPQVTALFRIAQEALTNVARHAQARHVRIYVSPVPDGICMVIEDDGVGFDPQAVRRRGSLGLLGMKERTLQLGGRFEVDSQPGAGTRLEVRIPKEEEVSP